MKTGEHGGNPCSNKENVTQTVTQIQIKGQIREWVVEYGSTIGENYAYKIRS